MAEAINQDSTSTNPTGTTEDKGSNSKTFTQDEVNAIVQKRMAEVGAKNDERTKSAIAEAIAEHDRKQKLTEEERLNEERKARDEELAEKERNITLRENRADAVEKLAELNIDTKLVDFVVDIDKDKTSENIDKLSKAFNNAVEKGVKEKLAGKTPTDFGNGGKTNSKKESLNSTGYHTAGMTAF